MTSYLQLFVYVAIVFFRLPFWTASACSCCLLIDFVGWLKFNVPALLKYGYIRDDIDFEEL